MEDRVVCPPGKLAYHLSLTIRLVYLTSLPLATIWQPGHSRVYFSGAADAAFLASLLCEKRVVFRFLDYPIALMA